jgi:RsiW-degrading membrane proteinase PrsW (M82 family)
LERFLHFPEVIEELFKFGLIYAFVRTNSQLKLRTGFLLGAVFGLGEASLYLINANLLLNGASWLLRLLFTVPMHATTALIISLFWRRGKLVGLALAIIVHLLFNRVLLSLI